MTAVCGGHNAIELVLLLIGGCLMRSTVARHNERPTQTGAWKVPTGFRAYHLDAPLASGIATLASRGHRGLTILDMGAGKGLYVRYLRASGLRNVTGYEGVHNIEELTSGRILHREFTTPFSPCPQFDVTICLEVAEHIPRDREHTFLANVNCSTRDGLIFSWAPPTQPGTGHVNQRKREDALARLRAIGFVVDRAATNYLEQRATLYWFKRNVIALHRLGAPSPFELDNEARALVSSGISAAGSGSSSGAAVRSAGGGVRTHAGSTAARNEERRWVDKVRSGYAKLEARVDELKLGGDVLLSQATAEMLKALSVLEL